jgi:hypothetical protein
MHNDLEELAALLVPKFSSPYVDMYNFLKKERKIFCERQAIDPTSGFV